MTNDQIIKTIALVVMFLAISGAWFYMSRFRAWRKNAKHEKPSPSVYKPMAIVGFRGATLDPLPYFHQQGRFWYGLSASKPLEPLIDNAQAALLDVSPALRHRWVDPSTIPVTEEKSSESSSEKSELEKSFKEANLPAPLKLIKRNPQKK